MNTYHLSGMCNKHIQCAKNLFRLHSNADVKKVFLLMFYIVLYDFFGCATYFLFFMELTFWTFDNL